MVQELFTRRVHAAVLPLKVLADFTNSCASNPSSRPGLFAWRGSKLLSQCAWRTLCVARPCKISDLSQLIGRRRLSFFTASDPIKSMLRGCGQPLFFDDTLTMLMTPNCVSNRIDLQ